MELRDVEGIVLGLEIGDECLTALGGCADEVPECVEVGVFLKCLE